jgi:hypothetical protein
MLPLKGRNQMALLTTLLDPFVMFQDDVAPDPLFDPFIMFQDDVAPEGEEPDGAGDHVAPLGTCQPCCSSGKLSITLHFLYASKP